jgi:hypothetical protein
MTFKIGTTARNAACNGIVDLVDGGAAAGYIEFRTGAPPTNPGDADSGTLLATCTMSDPAFGAADTGVATANSVSSDTSVDASGTPGHFRIKDSDGVVIGQGTVTITGGGGDFTFDSVTWIEGGTVAVSSLTITVPAS